MLRSEKEMGMKARTTLLVLACMLLVASVAGAATPATADIAAAMAHPAMSLLDGASACSTSLAATPLPGALPAPIKMTGATCGTCSRNPCIGATIGEVCVVGETRGTCQPPLGNNCSGGITFQCQCWSGPLP
jgi:hypothetical protein